MLQYWGRTAGEVTGKPLADAIPELSTQGFIEVMGHVYETGERFLSGDIPVHLARFGKSENMYINLTLEVLREESGLITGMMAVAADVTGQVTARQELEKVNETLKLAVDAAEMGIWKVDLKTDNLLVSERARIIHGLPLNGELSFTKTSELIIPEHRRVVLAAIAQAVESKAALTKTFKLCRLAGANENGSIRAAKLSLTINRKLFPSLAPFWTLQNLKKTASEKMTFLYGGLKLKAGNI